MTVFLVEDSDALRERLKTTLSSIPAVSVVGFADNAAEAIVGIEKCKPNAVLLDIHLKDSSGYQVLKALKARGACPTVIVLTNYTYPQYRARYMEAGADYFFDKSNEIPQVIHIIESLRPTPLQNSTRH